MYRNLLLVFFLLLWLGNSYSYAQAPTITASDIHLLEGKWKGSLTYLDYSTQQPYTMPADVMIVYLPKSRALLFSNTYPNEPKANNTDTVIISENGQLVDNEAVQHKTTLADGTIEITTAYTGTDGNDNKAALIRHTY